MHYEHATNAKRLQLALLNHLLKQPNRMGTVNGATNATFRREAYRDGGKWCGPAVIALKLDGVIEAVLTPTGKRTAENSVRHSRKGGTVNLWKIADEAAARRTMATLKKQLQSNVYGSNNRTLFDDVA